MLETKRINRIYMTLGFLGIMLLANSLAYQGSYGSAWKNGFTTGGIPPWGYTPYYYAWDYASGVVLGNTYGTHDWIAESALEILYLRCAGNQQYGEFVSRLYGDLRFWYLLGSEIPDSRGSYEGSGYSVSIKTSCDNWVQNDIFHGTHDVYFSARDAPPSLEPRSFNLASELGKAEVEIIKGFALKDCEYVAYYMGALAHLIGDASYYPHLITETDRTYMDYILRLTYKKYPTRSPVDFFNTFEARDNFWESVRISPYEGLLRACLDVRYGNHFETGFGWVNGDFLNADQLHDIFAGQWGQNSPFYGRTYEEVMTWNMETRYLLGNQKVEWWDFFWTTEHNLNTCIYYIAAAINFLLFEAFIDCDCNGIMGEDGIIKHIQKQEADWINSGQEGPWRQSWADRYSLSNTVAMVGLLLALVAVSVSKKMSLLVLI